MNYALVLAGGKGLRMNSKLPKQFLKVGDEEIIIRTLKTFINNKLIDKVILVCNKDYLDLINELLNRYNLISFVEIVVGGKDRMQSVINGCNYIKSKYNIKENDLVLTHDAVRCFVTDKIIEDNINICKESNACTTAVKSIDTIACSLDNKSIDSIPNRDILYNIQTPQTFNLKELFNLLKTTDLSSLTDLCGLYKRNNLKVNLVEGDYLNFKITTEKDLLLANTLINNKI